MPSGLTPKAASAVAGACIVAFGGSYALASSGGADAPEQVGVPTRALELPGVSGGPEVGEAEALPALAAPPAPAPVPVEEPAEPFTDTDADSVEPAPVEPAPVTPAPVAPPPVTPAPAPAPAPPPADDGGGDVDFDDSG